MFEDYLKDEHKADIWIYTVNPEKRNYRVSNAKDLTYEELIEAIEYSAHIPVMTEAGKVRVADKPGNIYSEEYVVDGGNIAHNPEILLAVENILKSNDKLISIYARDINFPITPNKHYNKNIVTNIDNTVQIFNKSVSLWGEFGTKQYCLNNDINRFVLYCPHVLDFNKRYLEEDTLLKEALIKTENYICTQLENYNNEFNK